MEDRIGEIAGEVWDFLDAKGESSLSGIAKSVDAPQTKVNMAIGWLAREEKLDFVEKGRGTSVRLE